MLPRRRRRARPAARFELARHRRRRGGRRGGTGPPPRGAAGRRRARSQPLRDGDGGRGRPEVDLAATRREHIPRRARCRTSSRPSWRRTSAGATSRSTRSRSRSPTASLARSWIATAGMPTWRAGVVRVLHPASFVDDPTRLLRALRYAARLDFDLESETERLAREAIEDGAMATVSGPRIRDELLDLLAEERHPAGGRLDAGPRTGPCAAPRAGGRSGACRFSTARRDRDRRRPGAGGVSRALRPGAGRARAVGRPAGPHCRAARRRVARGT